MLLIGESGGEWRAALSVLLSSGDGSWEYLGLSLLPICSSLLSSTEDKDEVESPRMREGVESGLCFGIVGEGMADVVFSDPSELVDIRLRKGFLAGRAGATGFATWTTRARIACGAAA